MHQRHSAIKNYLTIDTTTLITTLFKINVLKCVCNVSQITGINYE